MFTLSLKEWSERLTILSNGEEGMKVVKKATDGTVVVFEETPSYFKVKSGTEIWYWNKDNGKYDGHSGDPKEGVPPI